MVNVEKNDEIIKKVEIEKEISEDESTPDEIVNSDVEEENPPKKEEISSLKNEQDNEDLKGLETQEALGTEVDNLLEDDTILEDSNNNNKEKEEESLEKEEESLEKEEESLEKKEKSLEKKEKSLEKKEKSLEKKDVDASSDKKKSDNDKSKVKKTKKRKPFKIDLSKSPRLKKVVQDAERIEDINDLKRLRDDYNKGTRNLINKIKKAQIEISNIRSQAMDYRNKRDDLNKQVQSIKKDKISTSNILNESRTQLKDAKLEARKSDEGKKRKGIGSQIGKIRRKIDQLEKKIETEDLELREENQIVDEIDKLERELQELLKENSKPNQFKGQIDNIKSSRNSLRELNTKLRDTAEESQNYHLLYLDISKEMEDLRAEKRSLQRELNENRYIADIYHQRLIGISQKLNRQKRVARKTQYQNKRKVRKEINKITLSDAKDKMKKGVKLNIFEARAFLEEQAANKNK